MGGQYGGTLINGSTIRRNFTKWVDNTAVVYKMGGQYGETLLNGRAIRRNSIKFKWAGNTAELS